MKRILLVVLKCFFRVPYWWLIRVKQLKNKDKYTLEDGYNFIHKIVKTVNRRANITVEAHHLENIPEQSGYLLVPNHEGLFDPLAIFETHPKPLRAIVKKELTKTICIRDVIEMLEYVPLDRKNIREGARVIKYVTKEMENGQNFLVFPEGTRYTVDENGHKINKKNGVIDFKGGTFKIAVKAKAPIVPLAIIDSYKVFDENNTKPLKVRLYYLEPIYYDEYKDMHTNDIALMVQNRIDQCIKENTKS